jgi:hypothetical protein
MSLIFFSDQEMHMIRCHHVVQHTQPITLPSLEQPFDPTAPVPGKLQQKLLLVAPMGNVPDLVGNVISIGPRQLIILCLEGPF